jgi:hypothetical protein
MRCGLYEKGVANLCNLCNLCNPNPDASLRRTLRVVKVLATCFSTCLVMSSVAQLVSGFVFTPYVLRQRHDFKVIPPPVTCVVLMMCKMSSMFFSTAPIPT